MALPRHPKTLVRDIVFEVIKQDSELNSSFLNEDGDLSLFKHRSRKIFEHEFPAILVYGLAESIDDKGTDPKVFERLIQIEVQLMARDNEDADEYLASAARQIEYILLRWDGIILDSVTKERIPFINNFTLIGTQEGLIGEADSSYAGLKMQFVAQILDDDITGDQNEDFTTPLFTISNDLVDLDSLNGEITETNSAKIPIYTDLT